MKKYHYFILDAILKIALLVGIIWLVFNYFYIHVIFFASIAICKLIVEVIFGVKLIVDIIKGPLKSEAVFERYTSNSNIDFFYKINYVNVILSIDSKNDCYILFDDTYQDEIKEGDKVNLYFYQ